MKNEREKIIHTELLYETDGLLTEFEAIVTGCEKCDKRYRIILDRTAFFPEGGGQPSDTGILVDGENKEINVTSVLTVDGKVCHYTDEPVNAGETVTGKIDANKRFGRMQDHGAEHLICGLIHNMYGYENVGFHMSDEETVFDVDGPLTDEQIREIEMKANRIIFENVPITISFPDENEAKKIEYRSKLDSFENIRLVTIEGYDVCACCAPHVASTGQLGVVKILSAEPHRGGMRMTLVAGMNAYRDYADLHDRNSKIMEILSSKRDRTDEYVSEMSERLLAMKEERGELKRKITGYVTKTWLDRIKENGRGCAGPFVMFPEDVDQTGLRELVNACTKDHDGIVCAFIKVQDGYRYIFAVREGIADRFDIKALADDFNKKCCGKGGGSSVMVQGTTSFVREDIEKYFG